MIVFYNVYATFHICVICIVIPDNEETDAYCFRTI